MSQRPSRYARVQPMRLTEEDRAALEDLAHREGTTQSAIIRRAVRREIERAARERDAPMSRGE